ncbi:MAG: TRAP transporter small permease, partial [Stellaceae bacterium]
AFCLFLMMAITFAAVIGRYFLDRPITGGEEIKAFLLGFTVFAALPLVTAAERHIAVRSLANLLQGRALVVQRVIVRLGTAAGLGFIAWLLLGQATTLAASGTLTDFLDLPLAPPVFAFAGLTAAAALAALALLPRGTGGSSDDAAGPE